MGISGWSDSDQAGAVFRGGRFVRPSNEDSHATSSRTVFPRSRNLLWWGGQGRDGRPPRSKPARSAPRRYTAGPPRPPGATRSRMSPVDQQTSPWCSVTTVRVSVISTCWSAFGSHREPNSLPPQSAPAVERVGLEMIDRLGREGRPHVLRVSRLSALVALLAALGWPLLGLDDAARRRLGEGRGGFAGGGQMLFQASNLFMQAGVFLTKLPVFLA